MNNEAAPARERIFQAAVRLFARTNYDAVGIRDIAREAGVNIAGVNYYFGGKVGLLRAILERYIDLYWAALGRAAMSNNSIVERVRATVHELIVLYRDNIELALAGEKTITVQTRELATIAAKLQAAHRESNNRFFADLGIDLSDEAATTVMRGLLTNIISSHFQARYERETLIGPPRGLTRAEKAKLPELKVKYNDAFYERFARKLADFYLAGVAAIGGRSRRRIRRD